MPSKKPQPLTESEVEQLANHAPLSEKRNSNQAPKPRLKNIMVGFDESFLLELDSYLAAKMPGLSRNAWIRIAASDKLNESIHL